MAVRNLRLQAMNVMSYGTNRIIIFCHCVCMTVFLCVVCIRFLRCTPASVYVCMCVCVCVHVCSVQVTVLSFRKDAWRSWTLLQWTRLTQICQLQIYLTKNMLSFEEMHICCIVYGCSECSDVWSITHRDMPDQCDEWSETCERVFSLREIEFICTWWWISEDKYDLWIVGAGVMYNRAG